MAKPKLKTKPTYGPPVPDDIQPEMAPPVPPALSNIGSIGKPMMPSTPLSAAPPAPAPIGQPMFGKMAVTGGPPPVMPTDVQPPTLSPNPTPPVSIGTPIQPSQSAAISPAAEKLRNINSLRSDTNPQGKPEYHGLRRFGDALLGATTIGTAIERAGNFGTQGYEARKEEAQKDVNFESEQQKAADVSQKSHADVGKTEAETAGEQSENELVDMNGTQVMRKNVAPIVSADLRSNSTTAVQLRKIGLNADGIPIPENQLTPEEKTKLGMNRAHEDLMGAQAELARFRADPNSPMYKTALAHLQLAQNNYQLALQRFGYDYNPSILSPEQQATMPTDITNQPVGFHNPLKPGQTAVNAAGRAQSVIEQVPRIRQEIDEMANTIGPIQGRWNQFWQGQIGAEDQKFAHLADDMEYLSSAVALAHAYGRLPASISDKFDHMYQAGKQDPKNMIAALDVAMEWMPKIVNRAAPAGAKDNPVAPPVSADKPPAAQPGMKVQSRVVNGKTEYRQVPIAAN